ncbi:MAG: MarR family transcriptional regulator [Streptosporangiales bacterium]|nr:MarR family transcriptional regulator [Streptosporangiales bacterium]
MATTPCAVQVAEPRAIPAPTEASEPIFRRAGPTSAEAFGRPFGQAQCPNGPAAPGIQVTPLTRGRPPGEGLSVVHSVRIVPNEASYTRCVDEVSAFVEEAGLFYGRLGLSRTAGRAMGWLLASEAGHADAPELCEGLAVAKSSMSVALRQLEGAGLVERFRRRGERRDRYRLAGDVFARAFRAKMSEFEGFQALAQRGLAVVGDDPVRRRRLELMRDMYGFMAERFPKLLDEWDQVKDGR